MNPPEAVEGIDLFAAAVRREPYAHYQRLRREAPFYRSARHGAWVASRHADAVRLLDHRAVRHWAAAAAPGEEGFSRVVAHWIEMLDPRAGSALRRLAAPVFAPRSMEPIRGRLAALADRLLDAAAQAGRINVVGGFAEPIALAAMAQVIGVPDARLGAFHHAARDLVGRLFETVELARALSPDADPGGAVAFLRRLLADPGDPPEGTLLQAIRACRREADPLAEATALAFLVLFLFAGHENMMNLMGGAALALVEAPDQLALLRRDAGLIGPAVEELVRFASPVQFMSVAAGEEFAVRGQTIARGELVLICIGAANRDEDRFADPERLDITRADRGHLGFGHGYLTCIGAALARLEAEVAIGALAQRMHCPAIQGPVRLRRGPPVLRGFESLTVAFGG